MIKEFIRQFADLLLGFFKDLFPGTGAVIHLASASIYPAKAGTQQTALLHAMQKGVDRSRPDAIAVTTQFPDHPQAEDTFLAGMVQKMNTDQSRIKVFCPCTLLLCHERFAPANRYDATARGM